MSRRVVKPLQSKTPIYWFVHFLMGKLHHAMMGHSGCCHWYRSSDTWNLVNLAAGGGAREAVRLVILQGPYVWERKRYKKRVSG